jgi:hypothetical protein
MSDTRSPTEVVTPDWVKYAIFYQIFPDRFARSDSLDKPHDLEDWDSDLTPWATKAKTSSASGNALITCKIWA